MDQRIRSLGHWRPRDSAATWICAAMPIAFGLSPFLIAIGLLLTQSNTHAQNFDLTEWFRVTKFTICQAFISAISVTLFAPFFAVAMLALPSKLRGITIAIRTLLYCLPATVIATGFILAWGKSGVVSLWLARIGIDAPLWHIIYSPWGILLVNTTMNLPFVSILLFRSLKAIPGYLWEGAEMLDLSAYHCLKCICFPAMKSPLILITILTFAMSMGTFGALAILGGGPGSQTLEMSTYISLFTFANWQAAGIYASTHAVMNAVIAMILLIHQRRKMTDPYSDAASRNSPRDDLMVFRVINGSKHARPLVIISIIFDLLLMIPIFAIFHDATLAFMNTSVSAEILHFLGQALMTSLQFAVPVAALTTLTAWILSKGYFTSLSRNKILQSKTLLTLPLVGAMVPGMALGFGYMTIRSFWGLEISSDAMIIPILSTLALPFIIPLVFPSYARDVHPFDDIRILNGVPSKLWLKKIEGPAMFKPLLISFFLAIILNLNETSVVTLIRDPAEPALSTALIQLMGRYKFSEAAIGSGLIIFITFVFIVLASRHEEGNYGRS